jgi:hypothetical protein
MINHCIDCYNFCFILYNLNLDIGFGYYLGYTLLDFDWIGFCSNLADCWLGFDYYFGDWFGLNYLII